ncbi:MAG TPA: hypothetical protein PK431_12410 [Chitinophagales bacterium]|nr:hypothetical protein [Chitinophagales bacterium]
MKSKHIGFFLLFIAILAISIFYAYPKMLQLLPQGSHLWRQADCMAMTSNYKQFQLPFLQSATYNLQSVNGNVAGEFPLFYFLAAKFSNPDYALRCMHTSILFIGILSVYFIAFYFLERTLLSIFCALLIFTSPLLVFYGNNFLSDVPALFFALLGWSFFLNHHKKENLFWMLFAFLCFAMASLLKASESINFVLLLLFLFRFRNGESKFKPKISLLLFTFLLFFAWYIYAKHYNKINHDHYYFLSISPIWKLNLQDIGLAIWRMVVSNSKNYFWRPTSMAVLCSVYFLIKHWKKLNEDLRFFILSSFTLVALYILFFCKKMIGHEYYYVPFFVCFLFLIIGLLKVYNLFYSENIFAHTFLFLCLIPNVIFCKNFVEEKCSDNLPNGYYSSAAMQDFLEKNGVTKDKIVISLPDDSPNKTLYQIKRKGYTEFNDYLFLLKNKKADFLLLRMDCFIYAEKFKPFQNDSLGNFNGIVLYKLR